MSLRSDLSTVVEDLPKRLKGVIKSIEMVGLAINEYTIGVESQEEPEFCMAVRLGIPGEVLTRPYSPVRCSGSEIVCIIKLYPLVPGRAQFTPALQGCSVGDILDVIWYTPKQAIGEILGSTYQDVVMVSAGTGVAPMMQVLEQANRLETKHRFLSVSFNRGVDSFILKEASRYPKVDLEIKDVVTNDSPDERERAIGQLLMYLKERESERTLYLVCGPDSFVERVAGPRKVAYGGLLADMGVPESRCIKF
ncbi:cytochrome-b5 reductase [Nematocida homosporus]|uniref:cytochrome-b5 reductase n=1 Tax=Nematocida homosporus TaxID=1912981 RepID=UPI00221FD6F9|nr:cytochrome-b5 reductase [Nematocida homosporus]KAI5187730.1 cytochrome-b5 reductase [Nematocida homosporus]